MFSDAHREACLAHGIDIEESYKHFLLEIGFGNPGGPVIQHLFRDIQNPEIHNLLTPKQTAILGGYSNGHSRQRIADDLDCSVQTVASHMKHIHVRLGAKTTLHAVAIAIRLGLI